MKKSFKILDISMLVGGLFLVKYLGTVISTYIASSYVYGAMFDKFSPARFLTTGIPYIVIVFALFLFSTLRRKGVEYEKILLFLSAYCIADIGIHVSESIVFLQTYRKISESNLIISISMNYINIGTDIFLAITLILMVFFISKKVSIHRFINTMKFSILLILLVNLMEYLMSVYSIVSKYGMQSLGEINFNLYYLKIYVIPYVILYSIIVLYGYISKRENEFTYMDILNIFGMYLILSQITSIIQFIRVMSSGINVNTIFIKILLNILLGFIFIYYGYDRESKMQVFRDIYYEEEER